MNGLLSAIKAFVLKNRPAYKDYLGNGKYDIKKLPEECVPDSVNNNIKNAKSKADSAYSKANSAYSKANAAQSTANEIKNAVQPAGKYNSGIKIKTYIGFKDILDQYSSPVISSDINGLIYLRKSSNQTGVNLVIGNGTGTGSAAGTSIGSDGLMFSENFKIHARVTSSSYGPIISVYNNIDRVYVEFTKDACLVLPSSTFESTKKFKITVDDTGTISATEVT